MALLIDMDHAALLDRRLDQSSERVDVLASHSARRRVAIERAIRQIHAVEYLATDQAFTRGALKELLEEIAHTLEESNQVRAMEETEIERRTL